MSEVLSSIQYQVKFLYISSKQIYNYYHPSDARIKKLNNQNNFYVKLEASVLQHGILNPILVNAGFVEDHYWESLPSSIKSKGKDNLLICNYIGCSRLYVAQRHGLSVPCIVSDFVDMFNKDYELLTNNEDIMAKFTTPPAYIEWHKNGLRTSSLEHFHVT